MNAMFTGMQSAQTLGYLEDTYLTEAPSSLAAVDESGALLVETCLFHPQGGGQPADVGWVDDVPVTPIKDHATGQVLLLPQTSPGEARHEWAVGSTVTTRVDRDLRLQHAALHTAGHLIEAAGRSLGWELAGNNHFPGQARVEFTPGTGTLPETPGDRERDGTLLSGFVADAVAEDLAVNAATDGDGRRIVSIGELHAAPCGGTHVRSLGALAEVAVEVKVKKGRIRVSYTANHADMS